MQKISRMSRRLMIAIITMVFGIAGASAEFRWGPTAGVNFYDFHWKQDLIEQDARVGYNVGVMGEVMIPGIGFGIDFALKYNNHGSRLHLGEKKVWAVSGYGTETCTLHTLQIPLNLRFKWTRMNGLEDYIAPLVYAGPVFNITVGHSDLKALEYPAGCFGLQVGAGVELLKRIQLSGGYYWGLTYEIRTRKLDNFSARPQGWNINLSYLF